jgi:hypothetical protein
MAPLSQSQALAMIAGGETASVEFKRLLDFTSAHGKGEFVKDVIGMANTVADSGHLLVGVDNNKTIVGATGPSDEQVQQIVNTYITPAPVLVCNTISLDPPGLTIVIVEIRPTNRPHKVARTIEHITQNRVFIRHGTVVLEAGPEEVIAMHGASQMASEVRQYIRAAGTHAKLGNYELAVNAYSKAIELAPTVELFIARAGVYASLCLEAESHATEDEFGPLAFRDYSQAIELAVSVEQKLDIRINRWPVAYFAGSDWKEKEWESEFEWLKANAVGRDLGQILYFDLLAGYYNSGLFYFDNAAPLLDRIISLGYIEAKVYALRAEASFLDSNNGLALIDINIALQKCQRKEDRRSWLTLKGTILTRMYSGYGSKRRDWLDEAFVCFIEARKISDREPVDGFGYIDHDLEHNVLGIIALDHEFSDTRFSAHRQELGRLLARYIGHIRNSYPNVAYLIRNLVGDDYWEANRNWLERKP